MKRKIMAWILGLAMLATLLAPATAMAAEDEIPGASAAGEPQGAVIEENTESAGGAEAQPGESMPEGENFQEDEGQGMPVDSVDELPDGGAGDGTPAPGGESGGTTGAPADGAQNGAGGAENGAGGDATAAPDGEQNLVGSEVSENGSEGNQTEVSNSETISPLTAQLIAPNYAVADGGSVTVRLIAASEAAAEITVRYILTVDGETLSESEEAAVVNGENNYTFTPARGGIYTVRAEARDSEGWTAQASAEIAISEPEAKENLQIWYDAARQAAEGAGDAQARMAAVAVSQLDYMRSEKDFIIDENNYLQFYNIYTNYNSDWNAAFASWVAAQAGVEALVNKGTIAGLADAMAGADALLLKGYLPVAGDLVFTVTDGGAERVGVIVSADEAAIEVAEGDREGAVALCRYEAGDGHIVAFGSLSVLLGMGLQLPGADAPEDEAQAGGEDAPEPAPAPTYYCNQTEHIHTHGCYGVAEDGQTALMCGMEEHVHSEACLIPQAADEPEDAPADAPQGEDANEPQGEGANEPQGGEAQQQQPHPAGYLCGKEEHAHGEECYDENGELICGLEEHAHDESCLVPPQQSAEPTEEPGAEPTEEPGAQATEEPEYLCGKEEHAHGEDCYDENGELICGLEEHAHDESCLAPPEEPEHAACEYERDADGNLVLDEDGNPIPILVEGATEKPVAWLRDAEGNLVLDENGNPIATDYAAAEAVHLEEELDPNRSIEILVHWTDETAETHGVGDEVVLTAVLTGYDNAEYTLQWQTGATKDSYEDVPGATEMEYRTIVTEDNVNNFWRVALTITGVTDAADAEAEATEGA